MTILRSRIWSGSGFIVDTGEPEDDFILGTTMPQSTLITASSVPTFYKTLAGNIDTAGLLEGLSTISGLEPFDDYITVGGKAGVEGTGDINNPRIIQDKIFDRPIFQPAQGAGNVKYVNCFHTLASPGTTALNYVGLVNANAAGTDRWTFDRCHFDPTEEFAHPAISAAMGHHITLRRCTWQRIVDGYSGYRLTADTSKVLASEVHGCIGIWNSHFWDSSPAVVHTSDYQTHNDFIQIQGGGPGDDYVYGLDAYGNLMIGYNFAPDGVTLPPTGITNGSDTNRHLAHQAVLLQQNQARSTQMYSRVANNWIGGYAQPLTFKTHGINSGANSDGTPYNVLVENNVVIEDDQGLSGSSGGSDFYGVTGGHTHLIRIDPDISVNGRKTVYPANLTAVAVDGNNKYADTTNIHANRRGQPLHVRRDATYV